VQPLAMASERFLSIALERKELLAYLKGIQKIFYWIAFFLIGASLFLSVMLPHPWSVLLPLALLMTLAIAANDVANYIQNAARHRAVVALHQAAFEWLKWGVACVAMLLLGATGASAILGYIAAMLAILVSQAFFFSRTVRSLKGDEELPESAVVSEWLRYIWAYGWPFITWGTITSCHMASDRWGLSWFRETTEVGKYSVLFQLGYYPVLFLSGIVLQVVAPLIYAHAGDGQDVARLAKVHRWLTVIVGAMLLFVFAIVLFLARFHELVFSFAVAEEFREASWLLPLFALAGGLSIAGQTAAMFQTARGLSKRLIAPKVITATLGIVCNLIGAHVAGILGVVISHSAISLIYLVWMFLEANQFTRECGNGFITQR